MAESRTPEPPPEDLAPRGGGAPKAPKGGLWAWLALAALLALVSVQVAGVLLRDRLERRRPALSAPPAEAPVAPGREPSPAPAPPRFGPEVTEVEVAAPAGSPDAAGAQAPPLPPVAPLPPAVAAAPSPAARPQPAVPPARKAPAPPPAPPSGSAGEPSRTARPGTHALLVDVFLSQRYLRETEGLLKDLGVSSFRVEITRPGRGFRVAAPGPDRAKARRALEVAGYSCREGEDGVEAYVYYREEAKAAAEALARAGLESSTQETRGDRPFWKLYAGPFSEAEAREARGRLESRGLKTTLERRP